MAKTTPSAVAPIAATNAAALRAARDQFASLMSEEARLDGQIRRCRGLLDRGVVHTTPPNLRQLLEAEEALPAAVAALARVRLERLDLEPRLQALEVAEQDRLTRSFRERRQVLAVRFSAALKAAAREATLWHALIAEEAEATGTAPYDLAWPELMAATPLQNSHLDDWTQVVRAAGLLDEDQT